MTKRQRDQMLLINAIRKAIHTDPDIVYLKSNGDGTFARMQPGDIITTGAVERHSLMLDELKSAGQFEEDTQELR